LLAAFAEAHGIGTMPMIIASAVISTAGCAKRPPTAASAGGLPLPFVRARRKPIKMLFAGGTPMHMIAPVQRWNVLRVVCVSNSVQQMPASAPGNAVMMMKGSSQD